MYYYTGVFEAADWTHRGYYILKHGVTPAEADEALADPERLVINPDPASKSGRSVRHRSLLEHRASGADGHCS